VGGHYGCPPVANTHGGNIRVTGQGEDSKPHPPLKKGGSEGETKPSLRN